MSDQQRSLMQESKVLPPVPLVSVVIGNYNYAHFLGDTIQSVLDQSYENIEILVVDDGSTDNSKDIISAYEGRVIPIFSDHRGQCGALNAGFFASRGKVVIFLDSDDCLLPATIEEYVCQFKEHPEITKCQGYMNAVDAEGRPLGKTVPLHISSSGNYKSEVLAHGPGRINHSWTSGNAWARWFLEQVMPMPESVQNVSSPDGCLNPISVLYGPILTVKGPVAEYRIHGDNKGPFGYELSIRSLSYVIERRQKSFEFVAQSAKQIGLRVPVDNWEKGRGYWKFVTMEQALGLLDPARGKPGFSELVLAPFSTDGVGPVKAFLLSIVLVIVWFSPRKLALELIRRLLKIRHPHREVQPEKFSNKNKPDINR